eukprot:TRINITY_DN4117_c0_g1_i1.p1 TRINITY_DN4117_c0_g1~~TRINITY_DN4117_c0_g1_i1.p1  ORF type:complete len:93 (-),score=24.27 TRINITY_DN4117_c0_g1_i1:97-375(-)
MKQTNANEILESKDIAAFRDDVQGYFKVNANNIFPTISYKDQMQRDKQPEMLMMCAIRTVVFAASRLAEHRKEQLESKLVDVDEHKYNKKTK